VEVYPEPTRKLAKQLFYADARDFAFAAIIGESEREGSVVTLRDMKTRKQETIPRENVAAIVLETIKEREQRKAEVRAGMTAIIERERSKTE
jgi:histidyl-tRNA synthetase